MYGSYYDQLFEIYCGRLYTVKTDLQNAPERDEKPKLISFGMAADEPRMNATQTYSQQNTVAYTFTLTNSGRQSLRTGC